MADNSVSSRRRGGAPTSGARRGSRRPSSRRSKQATSSTLPPLPAGGVRLVPLGGLTEVGRNMMAVECDGRLLIIDVGVLFPDETQPGVDAILPDFDYLSTRWNDVDAVLLTHGHLDHIGALPYLLRHIPDVPVYGTTLTLALAEKICAEHKQTPNVRVVADSQRFAPGAFDVEAVAVNHSIPDAVAYALRTPAGMVVHTGDFKMDQFPLDGRLTDLRTFAALGQEGVALLCVDSTNADVPGFVLPEKSLVPAIDAVFARAKGMVVVSSFASHIHRVQMIVDTALRHGRKVAFSGRSMVANMELAVELGFLRVPPNALVDAARVPDFDPAKVALICTGSQGEPMAALGRMADGRHPVALGAGDTVLLASSMVPGNESSVTSLIDRLTARGVHVVHKGTAQVHTSGHAAAGELAYLYNVVRPSAVMPVHGEWRHLYANAALARATGTDTDQVIVGPNGQVVDLVAGKVSVAGKVRVGHVYVESAERAAAATVSDRRTLADNGVVQVVAIVDSDTGRCEETPDVLIRGLTHTPVDVDRLRKSLRTAIDGLADESGPSSRLVVEKVIVNTTRVWAQRAYRRAPLVMPAVVDA